MVVGTQNDIGAVTVEDPPESAHRGRVAVFFAGTEAWMVKVGKRASGTPSLQLLREPARLGGALPTAADLLAI
jgi:hypothetical protein